MYGHVNAGGCRHEYEGGSVYDHEHVLGHGYGHGHGDVHHHGCEYDKGHEFYIRQDCRNRRFHTLLVTLKLLFRYFRFIINHISEVIQP